MVKSTVYSCIRLLIRLVLRRPLYWISILKVKRFSGVGAASPNLRLNLFSGSQTIPGYVGIDLSSDADLRLDLSLGKLPFNDASVESVIAISGINYLSRDEAKTLLTEAHRVLKNAGCLRIGTQDLELLATLYLRKDSFFMEKLSDGGERFPGVTIADKFAGWFYGFQAGSSVCSYIYDFESLAALLKEIGFVSIERKAFRESRLENIELIDNRPEQMFFLEALK